MYLKGNVFNSTKYDTIFDFFVCTNSPLKEQKSHKKQKGIPKKLIFQVYRCFYLNKIAEREKNINDYI